MQSLRFFSILIGLFTILLNSKYGFNLDKLIKHFIVFQSSLFCILAQFPLVLVIVYLPNHFAFNLPPFLSLSLEFFFKTVIPISNEFDFIDLNHFLNH